MAKRGGGIFTYVADPITGKTKLTTLSIILILLLIVGIILAIVLPLTLGKKRDEPASKESGGAVAPPYSKRPGRINIAEVAQAPSAGQAIIYYSQAEEQGVLCDTCTAEFSINLSYVGGNPQPESQYKIVTSPSLNGVARFDYSVFTPPPTTGGQNIRTNTTPPTQVQVEISARSLVPGTGISGGTTTFSKTLPYVA
jgi:hypothetical protein